MAPLLSLDRVSKSFGATRALDAVSFDVSGGEVLALVGENGAGKSTLLNIIAGALAPDEGRVERGGGVAHVHQELASFPHLSVTENILVGALPARRGFVERAEARRRARELLGRLGHGSLDPDARMGDLPVGLRQVVELARALAADARIILLDEPTSSLGAADVERLFSLVGALRAEGRAIVYISHFLEELRRVADRFVVLRDGRHVGAGALAEVTDDALVAMMVGRKVGALYPARAANPGDPLLEVRGLASGRGLRSASFALRRGEILGIAGLVGSGRTELIRALAGLDEATAGTVSLAGQILPASPAARLAAGIGYVSEDRKGEGLFLDRPIADNITLPALARVASRGFVRAQAQRDAAAANMTTLGVRAAGPTQPVRALSGGNQQKVALARLAFLGSSVWLLDEPTRGVDVGSKAHIYAALAAAVDRGTSIVMTSSYLPELFGVADRLAVMTRGTLSPARNVADWTPHEVLTVATSITTEAA